MIINLIISILVFCASVSFSSIMDSVGNAFLAMLVGCIIIMILKSFGVSCAIAHFCNNDGKFFVHRPSWGEWIKYEEVMQNSFTGNIFTEIWLRSYCSKCGKMKRQKYYAELDDCPDDEDVIRARWINLDE